MSGLGLGDGHELACFRVGARRNRERVECVRGVSPAQVRDREVHSADETPEFVVRTRERVRIDLRTRHVALVKGTTPIVERELVEVPVVVQ